MLDVAGNATIRASTTIGGSSDAAPDLTVSGSISSASFGWFPSMLLTNTNGTQANGTSSFNRSAFNVQSGNGAVGFSIYTSYETGGTGNMVSMGSSTNHPLLIATNGTERMRIDTAGNVGIGTTSPGYALAVVGTINASSQVTSPYLIAGNYQTSTGGYSSGDGARSNISWGALTGGGRIPSSFPQGVVHTRAAISHLKPMAPRTCGL